MEAFPPELLAKIFGFLPGKEIGRAAQVCRRFYEASQVEYVWRTRCAEEFSIKVKHVGDFSFRDVYAKLLHRYRFYLGLWQPQVSSYGGLFQVKSSRDKFSFKCCDSSQHRHPSGKHQELRDWLHEEASVSLDMHQFPHSQELLLMKFLILRQYDYSFQYRRVRLQESPPGVPIRPGIFVGTYGTHGLELVQLEYLDGASKLRAVKLSGDPNVPCGQTTFEVVLQYGMELSLEQQASVASLDALDVRPGTGGPQPFRVPGDCHERFHQLPRSCVARYHGLGQVAGHGFTNPSFSRGHWVVFSEDLFGFLWLELLSLSMYHRVQEDLSC
ncbi:hypothetical protein IscW_ISCW008525 [Ixodes scapularis]|uniref:F-box domain-containing protein n=1 Tax=Ixodes scapularis TaxID=6945 RepID=B7Q0R3_IXOSC|nr:hypothetical protein IscW_ISCW008525 [Ixodes scapularis]|eukprot:XP_002408242.1 hypothetical protein IscW_ISCW008525 [Ixodes scapularis]